MKRGGKEREDKKENSQLGKKEKGWTEKDCCIKKKKRKVFQRTLKAQLPIVRN
jgi:hypothetical protein